MTLGTVGGCVFGGSAFSYKRGTPVGLCLHIEHRSAAGVVRVLDFEQPLRTRELVARPTHHWCENIFATNQRIAYRGT